LLSLHLTGVFLLEEIFFLKQSSALIRILTC